ncbi:MAG: hypothetical protein HY231_16755 [Acidobacteria bacterium]|nr:hypothetical protein [Acidobacteriota bacterium]
MKKITFGISSLLFAISVGIASLAATAAPTPAASELLNNLPDGGAVIVVDVQKLLSSSLFSQGKLKSTLDKVQMEISKAGLNLADINTAALSFPAATFNDPTIVVSGAFNQQTLLSHLRDSDKTKIETQKYKNFDVYTIKEIANPTAHQMAFAFLDANTVVAGKSTEVQASIDARNGDKPNVTKNAKLMEGLSQNSASAIHFALEMTPGMTKGLENSGMPMPNFASLQLIFGDVDVASGIGVNASLRNDTADHAKEMTEQLGSLLNMIKGVLGASNDPKTSSIAELLKSLKITNDNVDVKVSVSLPVEMLNTFFK